MGGGYRGLMVVTWGCSIHYLLLDIGGYGGYGYGGYGYGGY